MLRDVNDLTDLLSRTPTVVRGLLSGLPEELVRSNEGGDTWSPFDVVGHLIHGEKTDWIPRAKIILGDADDRTFEPFDRFAQFEESEGKSLTKLLDEFEALRKENLRELASMNIAGEDLERTGIHPELGEVTLSQLLVTWAAHDLDHIVQISRTIAKQFGDGVGPWKAYIRVLN
ncbi:MAG: DinB family protein [Aridibacter famidurans]|nr:DinB family protein [Aridibacter famidurans]